MGGHNVDVLPKFKTFSSISDCIVHITAHPGFYDEVFEICTLTTLLTTLTLVPEVIKHIKVITSRRHY